MLSGLTKVCFSYFLSICVHNQKLLYKHVTIASQSLIPISLLTVTLRFDESFLSEHSKTRNVDCWQRLCGKPMNMTLIFPKLIKRDSWEDKKTKDVTRCSSVQFRLLSLALCRCLSRWAWLAWRLLSRFLCLSLSLYSKLEDIMNENSRKYECKNNFCQLIQKKKNFFLLWVDFAEHVNICVARTNDLRYAKCIINYSSFHALTWQKSRERKQTTT